MLGLMLPLGGAKIAQNPFIQGLLRVYMLGLRNFDVCQPIKTEKRKFLTNIPTVGATHSQAGNKALPGWECHKRCVAIRRKKVVCSMKTGHFSFKPAPMWGRLQGITVDTLTQKTAPSFRKMGAAFVGYLFVVLNGAGLFHFLTHHRGLAADPVAVAVVLIVGVGSAHFLTAHVDGL